MKKIVFLFFAVGAAFLSSCNSASDDEISSITNPYDFDDAISSDSLFSIGNDFSTWTSCNDTNVMTRSGITTITAYGYTSYTTTGNRKTIFSSDLCLKNGYL